MSPRPRSEILSIAPYVGGVWAIPGGNRVSKRSPNYGALGAPPAAQAAYAALAGELHRYPDGACTALRRRSAHGFVSIPPASSAAPARTS